MEKYEHYEQAEILIDQAERMYNSVAYNDTSGNYLTLADLILKQAQVHAILASS